jgi:2-succinyl-6-hydroxy-2,4-cyclohexadiene-1-carboxylate synthase
VTDAAPTPVVLLHGFAATARHWDRVIADLPPQRFDVTALELGDADELTPDGITRLLAQAAGGEFVLGGYSMGGRLALHAALAMPERISRLVLVSTSAGIDDEAQRAARRAADELLAREIEQGTIDEFVERWRGVPLFAGDPDWVAAEVAEDERRCKPAALAASLRALGPGSMTPMWERLGELAMPVAVLAGARDATYVAAGRRLADAIGLASLRELAGVGHRVALENPGAVAAALAGSAPRSG